VHRCASNEYRIWHEELDFLTRVTKLTSGAYGLGLEYEQEIRLKYKRTLGVQQPFWQGGSIRITFPKLAQRVNIRQMAGPQYDLPLKEVVPEKREGAREYFGFVFLETDRGFLLVPFTGPLNPITLRQKLSFIDLSRISDEELKLLLEEE
jgi:hypothetical protein